MCGYPNAMTILLEFLSQRDKGLYIAAAADDLDDDIETNLPCPLYSESSAESGLRHLLGFGHKPDETFGKTRFKINFNAPAICVVSAMLVSVIHRTYL